MKKILYVLLLLSFNMIYSQTKGGVFEIYTQVIGNNNSYKATFELESVGSVWLQDWSNSCPITNNYNYAIAHDRDCSTVYIPANQSSNDLYGIYHTVSFNNCNNNTFANGFYKLKITGYYYNSKMWEKIVYLDYRTDDYPQQNSDDDIWVNYNATYNSIKIKWKDSFKTASEYSVFRIARQKNLVFSTDNLQDFWTNSLLILPKSNYNNPYLIWGPYPKNNATNYKIYRGLPSPIKPNLFIFNLIATVDSNVFEYVDHDIMLNPNGDEVRYYIKAIVNGSETEASNTVSTHGGLYKGVTPPAEA